MKKVYNLGAGLSVIVSMCLTNQGFEFALSDDSV